MTEETTVDPLHLDLDSTEMVIIDNDPGSHATTSKALLDARAFQPNPQVLMETKLQGVLSLTLPANGPVPKEIEMRFVGGAVSKLEDKNEGIYLRGTDRLFDKKIPLWTPNAQTPTLPHNHRFSFGLALPSSSPPTCLNDSVHNQYVLAIAMYYEGGCWGWIPAFAPDPVLVRQELTVRRVLGPLGQLRRLDSTLGVKDNLSLDYHPRASTGEEDSALVPTITQSDDAQSLEDRSSTFGHASIEWTPLKDVSVRLPGLITAAQSFVPVHVQVKGGLHKEFKVQQLSLSLVQHQTLYFKYNVNPSRSFESSYTDISLKKLTDKLDLYTAQFDIASLQCSASYDSSDNDQETLWIPHAQSLMPAMKHFLEDMSTGAAKVYHEWWLTLVTSQGTFEAKVPVLVVVSPLLKDPNSLFGSTEDELDQRTVVDGDEESVDEKDPLLLYKNSQKAFPGAASERDFAVAAEPHF